MTDAGVRGDKNKPRNMGQGPYGGMEMRNQRLWG